jgi:alpha-amylase
MLDPISGVVFSAAPLNLYNNNPRGSSMHFLSLLRTSVSSQKILSGALLATLLTPWFSSAQAATAPVPRTVMVHLFEWKWNDIASECETVLGPKGFSAVQVSPPQKSVSGSQWWTRYQPLSYAIEGRSGTRAEFASMVNRCKAVGVGIYVDAVINHMAALNRSFPEVPYGTNDFHTCTTTINYSNAWSIQNCDLSGLNDLKTESDYVRGKIANYLNDLTSLGVAGFRFDAAKHMPPADVSNIVGRLAGTPYIYQEVIRGAGEPVQPEQYTYIADVMEFNYSKTVSYYFKGRGALKNLSNIGTTNWSGWLPSSDAQVFVENHDNQRQDTGNIITYKDGGNLNTLAHVFMMGWPYGYPQIMSSYSWTDHDQGPPSVGASTCSGGWLCEHRIRAIANMVAFANNTNAQFRVTNYWDNGNNQMAWGRGGLGFVAINREDSAGLNRTFATGMPAGKYCDIIHADYNAANGTCSGTTITVDASGNATFSVATHDAVAFHVGAKVTTSSSSSSVASSSSSSAASSTGGTVAVKFTCNNGTTYMGQSVYVSGSVNTLGNWAPASAVKLNATSYPTWTGTIQLPANSSIQWKCLKRDEANPANGQVWQGGANNVVNTGSGTSVSASF